jgi:peptide deformylase
LPQHYLALIFGGNHVKKWIMALREIRTYPDPVLRRKTGRIETLDVSLERLIDDMVETMHAAPGVGLAANQVGIPLQVAVIDLSTREERGQRHPLLVLINPEILFLEGSIIEEEGCLSIPEYTEKVKRAATVKVRAQDRTGKPFEMEAEGLLAKALQHEIDHLNGLLFIDRLSPLKKDIFKRRYRKAAEQKA